MPIRKEENADEARVVLRQSSTGEVATTLSSCPYAQQMPPASDIDTSRNSPARELNYIDYLNIESILSAVHCLSHQNPFDGTSPPVHDEHFFIIIHQIFELWFKAFLFEIDSIREIFADPKQVASQLFYINLRLHRSVGIWNMLINMLQLLETMTPVAFLAFRDYVTPASGFQSLQFRIIEAKLGLTDQSRDAYKSKYFTRDNKFFADEQKAELINAGEEPSLLNLVEKWLEYIYDSVQPEFFEVFQSAVYGHIDSAHDQMMRHGDDEETAKRKKQALERQFAKMLNETEYEQLKKDGVRRMSQKAMLAAVMISLYHQQPCFQQCYQMLNLFMDVDALIASWRHKHVLLVQRQIGRKPGTAGTDGFNYLNKTVSDKYQIFIDLFNVSSYLIPQHFLPKVEEPAPETATSISSLRFQAFRPHQTMRTV